jgi:hypothetical protein
MNKICKSAWITMAVLQLLTGALHTLSFIAEPEAQDETGRQFLHLMMTYKASLGAGFYRTTFQIFTALSACFTLLYLLAGITNIYLMRAKAPMHLLHGMAGIQVIVLGTCFAIMAALTFLPPIVFTGLCLMACILAWLATRPVISQQ